ncbi:MAG: C-GCAxxG-C-C family protein [Terrisporobacter sp.]|uniref:C-GCAxxG-C-C family protein n=1 Tax=Terrisporobacter sp. TaxID=1965305 RepID=UPI002FCA5EDE
MEGLSLNNVKKEAEGYFVNGDFSCSESVLKALVNNFDMGVSDDVVKVASGFSGGMGGSGCTCGTISGAIIGIGLLFGRSEGKDPAIKKAKELSKKIHDVFKDEHKATCCRSLTRGLDPGTKERFDKCYSLVGATK